MKLAISYLRCSTPEQAQRDSIRRQIEAAEDYAAALGFKLDRTINFCDEGLSGYSGANRIKGKLGLLLARVKQGLIPSGTALLVENIDRLSREHPLDSIELIKQLVEAGIEIHTITNRQVYTDARLRADFSCMLMLTFELGRGCGESQRKSYLLTKTWKQKRATIAEKKLTSICPQWLVLKEDGDVFDIIPDRAAIVKRIFALSNSGYGKRRIAAYLNSNRIETWGRGRSKAVAWHASYVHKILRNRAVLGEFQAHRMESGRRVPEGSVIQGYFPAVIDELTFAQANCAKLMTGGRTRSQISNLFAGLVYDGYSEAHRMLFVDKGIDKRRKNGHGNNKYLRSSRIQTEPDDDVPSTWNYSEFEHVFLRAICEIDWHRLQQQRRPAELVQLEHELAKLDAEISAISTRIERILIAIADEAGATPLAPMATIKRLEGQKSAKQAYASAKQKELRALDVRNANFAANLDSFKRLAVSATDPRNIDLRLRLREEIRRKVRRIDLYPSDWPVVLQMANPWLNPSLFFVVFTNGGARVVAVQSIGRGKPPEIHIYDAPNAAISSAA